MTLRRFLAAFALALLAAPASAFAATYTTTNFIVDAPDAALARRFGESAEFFRKEKALEWLGQEMPTWPARCPLSVRITDNGAGGETSFGFSGGPGRGVVSEQRMKIFGPVRQLLNSVLPHEITHTVFAYHFGQPVPRWADEGGSVLSENDEERTSHDIRCREILNQGKAFRLSVLFGMVEYPRDMIVLYAEGYSACAFLVERGGGGREGRRKLLNFLSLGMQGSTKDRHGSPESWNAAAQRVYGIDSTDALEAAWIENQKNPGARVAARNTGNTTAIATPASGKGVDYSATGRSDVRSSAAPALPLLEPPVRAARGAAPETEAAAPSRPAATRPTIPDRPPPILLPPEIPRPNR
ncbi:MAG TPA: hypothetical protein VGL71_00960 [Urbifossiella sp.]